MFCLNTHIHFHSLPSPPPSPPIYQLLHEWAARSDTIAVQCTKFHENFVLENPLQFTKSWDDFVANVPHFQKKEYTGRARAERAEHEVRLVGLSNEFFRSFCGQLVELFDKWETQFCKTKMESIVDEVKAQCEAVKALLRQQLEAARAALESNAMVVCVSSIQNVGMCVCFCLIFF